MVAKLFGRGVPAYMWIAVFYVLFVMVIAVGVVSSPSETEAPAPVAAEQAVTEEAATPGDGTTNEAAPAETPAEEPTMAQRVTAAVEQVMTDPIVSITFFSGVSFPVTWTTLFIIAGFVSAWIEALRATNVRVSGNDFMSLIVTIVALVLFVGVPFFSTTAFMIVPLVGLGDLILDRYIGQAVARRDFGPMYGGPSG